MYFHRFQNLIFFIHNLKSFIYLISTSGKKVKERIIVVNQLIIKCNSNKKLETMKEFLVETYANMLFEYLEKGIPSATDIVVNEQSYKEVLQAYLYTLNWQCKIKSSQLYKIYYRIAICYCRLSNFRAANNILNEAIESEQNINKKQILLKIRAACSRLQELSPDCNIWKYLSVLQQRNITAEEFDYLKLIQHAMHEIKIVNID